MRRYVEWLAACLVGLALSASAGADGVPTLDLRTALESSQAVVGTVPPDFTLLDGRERPRRISGFRGKPLLVSFIYTGCFTICPTQTRQLHEAVRGLDRLLGPDRFNVVSIGFNQPFDSPRALAAFATQQGIDYPNWAFLSPHAKHVDAMTRAFGFSYVETPAGFDHIVGVTVLDAEGRVHAQVYGDQLSAAALGVPLQQLVLENYAADGPLPSLEQLVDRVRILCTVYDPETGEYRYDWTLLLQIVGGLGFFVSAGIYLFREWRSQRPAADEAMPGGAHSRGGP